MKKECSRKYIRKGCTTYDLDEEVFGMSMIIYEEGLFNRVAPVIAIDASWQSF